MRVRSTSKAHPPVIYPGSIERVDFGEAGDEKFYVIARVEHGHTEVEWRKLTGIRPFLDRHYVLKSSEDVTAQLIKALPHGRKLEGAILRLVLEYPREWEALIDDAALREYTGGTFEFHFIKRPMESARARLAQEEGVSSLTHLELLDVYWRSSQVTPTEHAHLQKLAQEFIEEPEEIS